MVGVPHLATFHSTTKAMMSKVLLRGRPLNPEGEWTDRICRDKNIYFLDGTGQILFPYIHKNKTHHVARLTHNRKVADSVPPSNEPRAIVPALCQNRSQDDPKPPFHRLRLNSSSKVCIIHWAAPVITYHTHLCCFVFATTFFSFCFSLFWKKKCAPFSSPSYATEFVYLPVVKYIQAHIPTRRV